MKIILNQFSINFMGCQHISRVLSYGTRLMYCISRVLSQGTRLTYCISRVLSRGTRLIGCSVTAPSATSVVDTWQMSLLSASWKPSAFSCRYRVLTISRGLFFYTRLIDGYKLSPSYLSGVFLPRHGVEAYKPSTRKKALGL